VRRSLPGVATAVAAPTRRTRFACHPAGNRAHFLRHSPEALPACNLITVIASPLNAQNPAPTPHGGQPGPLPEALATGRYSMH
jgi:hypothetical protein